MNIIDSVKEIEKIEKMYMAVDGVSYTLEEGCLGYGLTVFTAPGYKAAIVKEIPMNEWTSAHSIRFYNRLPEKYRRMIADKFGDLLQ